MAQAAQRRACLQDASAPDVPFCTALRRPAAVVLARCSAPERVRLIADSGAVGGTHSTGCRERFYMLCSRGRRPPCLLRLLHPERHFDDRVQGAC